MSEAKILLCGPGFDTPESQASLDRLSQIEMPGATKIVVATGKLETNGIARRINVDAEYAAEIATLQTSLHWAGLRDVHDPRFRDGFDLFSLNQILAKFVGRDFAVLLRSDGADFDGAWPELKARCEERPFFCFGGDGNPSQRNLIVNLHDRRWDAALQTAWELYRSGAVYALAPYALDAALDVAVAASVTKFQGAEPQSRAAKTAPTGSTTG